jgi:D-arabinose 1-dehydrogenase-like Zn-dependent alcohol dehydrogenase
MRDAVITKFNEPWEMKQLPDPRPQAGKVFIRVRASGMCGTDLHVHHGMFPLPTPLVAGHEPVGEIAEVGAGVTTLRVGDRVGVHWNQKGCGRCAARLSGREGACANAQWMQLGGGNSELMLAWPSGCLVNMGVTEGPIAVDPMTLMMGQRQLRGSSQDERSDLYEALQLVAAGKVKPALETYPLEQANAVRERLAAGKVRYRAVLLHAR